ncbi:hypothetical protein [Alkalihalophilus marmarensis]|uniref:hypothetical protein n=1 Tax=Alkalihalophilus marmarensis TaxID=521377 RepID=UPI002DBF14C5|nr:hypothetical protein [Alkalihalophilus marmarensis]MEC2074060.1 hypothetical protein [Alkalihalophilus marmarensis]
MYVKLIATLLFLVILIGPFFNKTYTYSGEEYPWTAELSVTQTYYGFETQEFVLTYIGENMNRVGDIDYSLKSVYSFGGAYYQLDENGTITHSVDNMTIIGKISEDTNIIVTVGWEDEQVKFNLQRK